MALTDTEIAAIAQGVGAHLEVNLRAEINVLREEILGMCKIRHDALNLIVAPLNARVEELWDKQKEQGGIIKASRWWIGIILGGLTLAVGVLAANAQGIWDAFVRWAVTRP